MKHVITLDRAQIDSLLRGDHSDPFSVLGPHRVKRTLVVRAVLPNAVSVTAVDPKTEKPIAVFKEPVKGYFEARLGAKKVIRYKLRIDWGAAVQVTDDPYRFGPVISDSDMWLLSEGTHKRPWTCFGARPCVMDGVAGVAFAVWAPGVRRVSVVGDFNSWDGRRAPMRLRRDAGVWEIFLPGVQEGQCYKYEIIAADGQKLPLKADPYAFRMEMRPGTASIICALPERPKPIAVKNLNGFNRPMSIYEVHLGSWMRHPNERFYYNWEELSERLVAYVKKMGFTHIELLPVSEHPFDGSWGYQALGLYAPTARFGAPEGFVHFVSTCHEAGIGVIVDWVPAHFPKDESGLARFTGVPLYEYADPREGEHKDWGTYIYNLGRREVLEYLVGNALFWAEVYGVDGLRVDAVASMLYRDYSRKDGEWIPNVYGGRENLESIAFLRRVNETLGQEEPNVATFAEESTAWPMVSRPPSMGGLGFHYKWNMGWMHDVLNYMHEDPVYRRWHHNELTFGLLYAYSENFVLPLSHDEVVHGKGSLLEKMSGDDWQKFANLRAFYGFMWAYPGKKLLFMGGEFAQRREWNDNAELDWGLLQYDSHKGVQHLVTDLNKVLKETPALYEKDCEFGGFEWLDVDDKDNSVVAFARWGQSGDECVVCISNFTPVVRHNYRIGVPKAGTYREILNTDSAYYWGSNVGTSDVAAVDSEAIPFHGKDQSVNVTLPPLATIYLKWHS